ncbi:MAG: GNAT family protein [Candidatus Paceibacterota bacterium]|jgi:RimJ/RimL family protein N-acetyltransferase
MNDPFIIGERIYLRAVTEEDLPNYFSWLNDQETTRWMQRGIYPNNMDEMREYMKSLQRSKDGIHLAIVRKEYPKYYNIIPVPSNEMEPEKHIGNITLLNIHPVFRSAEISIIIGDGQYRGNGYGTEAIKLLVDHAFTRMNLNRLQAGAVVKNLGSIKAFEKAGFQKEGILRRAYYCEGEYQDVQIMSILKDDWRKEK